MNRIKQYIQKMYTTQLIQHMDVVKTLVVNGHKPDNLNFIIKTNNLETHFITSQIRETIHDKTKLIIKNNEIIIIPKFGLTKQEIIEMWNKDDVIYLRKKNTAQHLRDLESKNMPLL